MKIILTVLTVLGALALPILAQAEMKAVVVDGTVTIRPTDKPTGSQEAKIFAAKNEYEPFQVVVSDSDEGALSGVDAEVTDLVSDKQNTLSSDNIFLFREHLIDIYFPSHKPFAESTLGYWPDPLVPFKDRYFGEDRNGAPFDVPEGENRVIWAEVYVPLDTPAGTYTGTMTVTSGGKAAVEIPITLTVWDFALPEKITLSSVFLFSCGLANYGHTRFGGSPQSPKSLALMYYAEALRHRMTLDIIYCNSPPVTYDPINQTVTIDFTEHDEFLSDVLDGNLIETQAEFTTYLLPWSRLPDAGKVLFWREWGNHFRDKGWFDKLFYYLPDEPKPEMYPEVARIADLVHEADPELRTMVTEQFENALAGHIDIWCPDTPFFSDTYPWMPDPSVYPERQALGEEVWWYNCCSAAYYFDYLNFFVDSQGIYARIFFWLTRRYHFTGVLYWHMIYAYGRTDKDLWEDAYEPQWGVNGDGTLYYPGTPAKIGGTKDIPVPSIRLKRIREGFEDYEYFHILDEMGYSEWVDEKVKNFSRKSYDFEHDTNLLYKLRRQMAEKIMGTLDEDAPDVPQNLSGSREATKVTLSWAPSSAEDVAGYRVYLATEPDNFFIGATVEGEKVSATIDRFGVQYKRPFWFAVSAVDEEGNESELSNSLKLDYPEEADDDDTDDDTGDRGEESEGCGC